MTRIKNSLAYQNIFSNNKEHPTMFLSKVELENDLNSFENIVNDRLNGLKHILAEEQRKENDETNLI